MNMLSRSLRAGLTLLASGTCLVVIPGCAMTSALPAGRAGAEPYVSRPAVAQIYQVRQLGTRDNAHFALCLQPACPGVSPKTLALLSSEATQTSQIATTATAQEQQGGAREDQTETAIVHFDIGSARLDRRARDTLAQFAAIARRADRIVISGRTDSTGGSTLNGVLAHARALAVVRYLREARVAALDRVEIDARGRCCYAAHNDEEAGRQFNRRAEVSFYQPVKDTQ